MSYKLSADVLRAQELARNAYIAILLLGVVAFSLTYYYVGFNWNFFVNGVLCEFIGSCALLKNVLKLHVDKMVRGYHWSATAFFMGWGYWNIYYYPSVGDWWSFTGGLFVVSINTFWLAQMMVYRKN